MAKKNKKHYKGYRGDLAKGYVDMDDGSQLKYSTVYNYVLTLTEEEIEQEIDKRVRKYGYYPSMMKVLKTFILKKFFPHYLRPYNTEVINAAIKELEQKLILIICYRLTEETSAGARQPDAIMRYYMSYVYKLLAQYFITRVDGKVYHVVDSRICEDDVTQATIEGLTLNPKNMLENSHVLGTGLAQIMCAALDDKAALTRDEYFTLAKWYLEDLHLQDSKEGAYILLSFMNELLEKGDKDFSDLILETYEAFPASFNKMMGRYPGLNFIIRGKSEKYASIAEYAKKHPEETEFFIEEANGEHAISESKKKRQENKIKRNEHREKVLEALDLLFLEVQKDGQSTDIHVLNFTPNEVKTKKPNSDFIGVAFKRGDKWWILVDCIKPGVAAIYLWRGERYTQGLETFKMARSYARQEPGVVRKNHVKTRKFIEIYHLLMEKW